MNLGAIPRRNSRRFPEKPALVFQGVSMNWQQVNNRVNALVHALGGMGLVKGERLGILMQNRPHYWEIYWAAAKAGIIAVPLNYRLTPGELEILANHAGIKALVVGEESFPQVNSLRERVKTISIVVGIGKASPGMADYEELVTTYPIEEPPFQADDNDTFAIFYTSGTTGLPKGAMVSHRNLEANSFNQMLADHSQASDVNLTATPLYHMGAVFFGLTYQYLGCTTYINQRFDPIEALEAFSRHKITVCLLIPTMLNMLLNVTEFEEYDLSNLRLIFYGGGPMPQTVLKKAIKRIGCGFTQGYGLTETLEATFLVNADHVIEGTKKQRKRLFSAGREAVSAEVRIVNDSGKELPNGEVGEIIIRSDSVIQI